MIFTKPTDTSTFSIMETAKRGSYSFADNYSSAVKMFNSLNASDGQGFVLNEVWGPIVERVNEVAEENDLEIPDNPYFENTEKPGKKRRSVVYSSPVFKNKFYSPGAHLTGFSSIDVLNGVKDDEKYKISQQIILDFIQDNKDLFPEYKDLTTEKIGEKAKNLALEIQKSSTEVSELSPGFSSGFARFLGTAKGAITDPKILASLVPSVAASFIPGANIYAISLAEGIIASSTEVFIQKDVKKWYEELGLDYTPEQFRNAVITAGLTATGATYFLHIAGKTIQLSFGQVKKGYNAFKEAGLLEKNPVQDQRDNALARVEATTEKAAIYDEIDVNDLTNSESYVEFKTKTNAVANGEVIPLDPQNKIAPEAYDNFDIEVNTKTNEILQAANVSSKNLDLDFDIIKKTNELKKQFDVQKETISKTIRKQQKVKKQTDNILGEFIYGADDGLTGFGGTGVFRNAFKKNSLTGRYIGTSRNSDELLGKGEVRGDWNKIGKIEIINLEKAKLIRATRNAKDASNRDGVVGVMVAVPKNATKEQIDFATKRANQLVDNFEAQGVKKGQVTKSAEALLNNLPKKEKSQIFDAVEEIERTVQETVQKKVPKKVDLEEFRAEAEKDVTSVYTHAHDAKEAAIRKNVGDDAADAYNEAGLAKANKLAEKRQGQGVGLDNPRGRLYDDSYTTRQLDSQTTKAIEKFDDVGDGIKSDLEALKVEALENVGGDVTKEIDIPIEIIDEEVVLEMTSLQKMQKTFNDEDAMDNAVSGCS
tara:strand:- start:3293 stop:5584 length:2292 start_codon:yes stop_codon:yes gene_type:complete